MKKRFRFVLPLLALLVMASSLPVSAGTVAKSITSGGNPVQIVNAGAASEKGWYKQGSKTFYGLNNGKLANGQYCIDGKWYMFDYSHGVDSSTGKPHCTGSWTTGQMIHDVFYTHSKVTNKDGAKTVYYQSDGTMATGQKKIGGYWYMFDYKTGAMKTGFVNIPSQNKTVYYDVNGRMLYGQQKINGYWYNFKQGTGAMQKGFVNIPSQNKTVYYDENGRMVYGQKQINGYWYNFKQGSGAMITGWLTISTQNKTVYYDKNGRMVKGMANIGGTTYLFDKSSGKKLGTIGQNMTWIGDSYTYGAAFAYGQNLVTKAFPGADVYGQVSRGFFQDGANGAAKSTSGTNYVGKSGMSIVKDLKSKNKLRKVVVFPLATNNAGSMAVTSAKANELYRLLPSDSILVLVGAKSTNGDNFNTTNASLKGLANAKSNVYYYDWPSSGWKSNFMSGDRVHLSWQGYQAWVNGIAGCVNKIAPVY